MRRAVVFGLLIAVGACAEAPFIDRGITVTLTKPSDRLMRSGTFNICFNDGDEDKAWAMAKETCGQYGLVTLLVGRTLRYQCRISAPHTQAFQCVDPTMKFANGTYVNPLNREQLKLWKRQQERLAARKAQGREGVPTSDATTGEAPIGEAPIGEAPLAARRPVAAADAEAAPVPPIDTNFNLPAGDWGQAWDGGETR